ncbi:SMP-30/gluconolactonase/LRE family protein [Streptomyces chartreusis]|uniref:SMP-30/gluconolactonase/LRE family protein n=1 Tax=Streptomyces chartreusis TaxID=1969 RepID=A0A7I0NSS4_STRCX|nr:hypothetical protein [Streptomyces chartreusis]QKZ16117.1 hypothetical protein HUT05_01150 [Streptomyces chartreusis]
MKNPIALAAAIAAMAGILGPAPSASAATAHEKPVVTHVKIAVAFDFEGGESAENITANPDGSLTVSQLGTPVGKPPKLERISASGRRTVLVTGQAGDGILGNTRGPDGTLYFNVLSADASRSGVWALSPNGTPHRIAALPTDGLPNGLAIDPSGETLYVADSRKSTIWAVPTSGGTATEWLTDVALAPAPTSSLPLGANGLRFHNDAVWVSNTDQGTLMRVPVTATGKAGRIRVVTDDVVGIDDFNFLNAYSDVVFAALNGPNEIEVVYPNGSTKTALTVRDGLGSPTAIAVRGTKLYITNAGFAAPNIAKLLQGKINISSLL